jgi:hypothetical protein
MCYATFNIITVIYQTCAVGSGIQEAHTHSPKKQRSTTTSCITINVEILVEL